MSAVRQKAKTEIKRSRKLTKTKVDRELKLAITNIERLAKERIYDSSDPFATGVKIAEQIRKLAERIEGETQAESITMTEAGYTSESMLGVGI